MKYLPAYVLVSILASVSLSVGCANQERADAVSTSDALTSNVDEACEQYALSPDRKHIVYGACDVKKATSVATVFRDLGSGTRTSSPAVPRGLDWNNKWVTQRYLPFTEGVVFLTAAGFELEDWKGTTRAVAAIPPHPYLDPAYRVMPIQGGAGVIALRQEEDPSGWRVRTAVASGGGPTSSALSLPAPTADKITHLIAAPDGSHVLVRVESADLYRVPTNAAALPTLVAHDFGFPTASSYDGQTLLVTGRGPAHPESRSSLFSFEPATALATPISSGPVESWASASSGLDEYGYAGQHTTSSWGTATNFVEHASKVYFAENDWQNDEYTVKVWDRATPSLPATTLAAGAGKFGNLGPALPFVFTAADGFLVYETTIPKADGAAYRQVHVVRLDGSNAHALVGEKSGFSEIATGPAATIAFSASGSSTLIIADLQTGQTRTTATNGSGGGFDNLVLSGDGATLYDDRDSDSGITVLAGWPGPGMRPVYHPTDLFRGPDPYPRGRATLGAQDLLLVERTSLTLWRMVRVTP